MLEVFQLMYAHPWWTLFFLSSINPAGTRFNLFGVSCRCKKEN